MRGLSWLARELLSSPEGRRSMDVSLLEAGFSFESSSRSASRRHLYRAGGRASCMIVNASFSQVSWRSEDVPLVLAVCNGPIYVWKCSRG